MQCASPWAVFWMVSFKITWALELIVSQMFVHSWTSSMSYSSCRFDCLLCCADIILFLSVFSSCARYWQGQSTDWLHRHFKLVCLVGACNTNLHSVVLAGSQMILLIWQWPFLYSMACNIQRARIDHILRISMYWPILLTHGLRIWFGFQHVLGSNVRCEMDPDDSTLFVCVRVLARQEVLSIQY